MDWINFKPWIRFLPLPAFATHDEGADESAAQLLRIVGDDVPDFRLQKIDISGYKKNCYFGWKLLVTMCQIVECKKCTFPVSKVIVKYLFLLKIVGEYVPNY